MLIEFWWENLW